MFKSLFTRFQPQSHFENINVQTVNAQLGDGDQWMLIDVRSAEEYATGRIVGSLLLPLPTLAQRHNKLPKETPLIVTCRSGARSRAACDSSTSKAA